MRAETDETVWLDSRCTVGERDLALSCRLTVAEIEELVEYGLLLPAAGAAGTYEFAAACVLPLRKACALGAQFDLDVFVLGLLYSHLAMIARLEQELHSMKAHLPQAHERHDRPDIWREGHP